MHAIQIVGPREVDFAQNQGKTVVWTVSNAPGNWQSQLSPFLLGPVELYGGRSARCMENGWQFGKLYAEHADAKGEPTQQYWEWAERGWGAKAIRYPMGKGAKPLCMLWDGRRLAYIEARKQVYWELYRDAVAVTPAFKHLQELHAIGPLTLMDFDGYDHEARGLSLADVIEYPGRPMGHAFVLKAMLLFGPGVSADEAVKADRVRPGGAAPQGSLF